MEPGSKTARSESSRGGLLSAYRTTSKLSKRRILGLLGLFRPAWAKAERGCTLSWVFVVVLTGVMALPLVAQAADLYVSPNGTGDCSLGNPCTFQTALTKAQADGEDDTINAASGIYDITSTLTYARKNFENYALTIKGAGASSTILDGGGSVGALYINTSGLGPDDTAHITIQGMIFRNGQAHTGGGLYIGTYDADITVEDRFSALFRFGSAIQGRPLPEAHRWSGEIPLVFLPVQERNSADLHWQGIEAGVLFQVCRIVHRQLSWQHPRCHAAE